MSQVYGMQQVFGFGFNRNQSKSELSNIYFSKTHLETKIINTRLKNSRLKMQWLLKGWFGAQTLFPVPGGWISLYRNTIVKIKIHNLFWDFTFMRSDLQCI